MISRSRLTGHCHPSLDTRSLYSEAMYTSSSNELEFVDIRTILNTTSSIVRGQTYKDNRLLHRFIKEISSLWLEILCASGSAVVVVGSRAHRLLAHHEDRYQNSETYEHNQTKDSCNNVSPQGNTTIITITGLLRLGLLDFAQRGSAAAPDGVVELLLKILDDLIQHLSRQF